MTMTSERILGGEAGDRTIFGQQSRPRLIGLGVVAAGAIVLAAVTQSFWPFLLALIGMPVVVGMTQKTHRGTALGRWTARRRWKARVKAGHDRFVPWSEDAWEAARAAEASSPRRERRAAARELAGMRVMPDGAAGLGWLRSSHREPGIAWQSWDGAETTLTVTFEVGGQLRGLQSAEAVDRGAEAFGLFLANYGASGKLLRRVQTITRVMPADTAEHEAWVVANLASDASTALQQSYSEVVQSTSAGSMTQRHFIVCSWPISAGFLDVAASRGEGREGWRELMDEEIASVEAQLHEAHYTFVRPLSARRTAALMRHMQDPDMPLDSVADVEPDRFGVPSADTFSAYVTQPNEGSQWWHRTARLSGEAFAAVPRRPLWHLQLLSLGLDCVRTISFHHVLIPAAESRARAERDLTSDMAEQYARARKGQVGDTGLDVTASAAIRRSHDIAPGSSHHGDAWVGYVTISGRSKAELQRATRQLEDTCISIGIEAVEWMDSYQAAAAGTTWPLGRGARGPRRNVGARVLDAMAGKKQQGEL
ncbi:hypothetical protein [Agrococcus casei]|uniref:Putative membrane protein n=1 Tax=Agrococcus casei LMG 22410 TaxID=1255656 RepID=A0A1R4FZ36_9MICO|nr:hypothetical protein [Agrococcus casei]SJM61111.1 putative membrane protein [Agrococcus casei LMG 22410]